MINPRRGLRYLLLDLNGYLGRTVSIDGSQKVTVLLTYYHPARMKRINSVLRNYLKCGFVERVVVTNHNPAVDIREKIKVLDERIVCINQDVRRGNGYRWRVANSLDAEYFIVVDDDVVLFPEQVRILFQHLLSDPAVPHGFAGQIHHGNEDFEYRERENNEIDYLCELYAVSRTHVKRYAEIEDLLARQDATLAGFVERFADHIVISQTTPRRPVIHKIGRLLRSETFKSEGIATHKNDDFYDGVIKVCRAVKEIKMQTLTDDQNITDQP